MSGKATASGAGWPHQERGCGALASFVPGMPGHHCGRPTYRWPSPDLDYAIPRSIGRMGGNRHPDRMPGVTGEQAEGRIVTRARWGSFVAE